jgi:hypothetical protein
MMLQPGIRPGGGGGSNPFPGADAGVYVAEWEARPTGNLPLFTTLFDGDGGDGDVGVWLYNSGIWIRTFIGEVATPNDIPPEQQGEQFFVQMVCLTTSAGYYAWDGYAWARVIQTPAGATTNWVVSTFEHKPDSPADNDTMIADDGTRWQWGGSFWTRVVTPSVLSAAALPPQASGEIFATGLLCYVADLLPVAYRWDGSAWDLL